MWQKTKHTHGDSDKVLGPLAGDFLHAEVLVREVGYEDEQREHDKGHHSLFDGHDLRRPHKQHDGHPHIGPDTGEGCHSEHLVVI